MSTLTISVIVFACVLGAALLGMYLGRVLPNHQLTDDAKDAIKVSMAMVATMAALVLGLMTSSAKTSLDDKENELRGAAAQVILLDRTMALYGMETGEARDLLKRLVAARMSQLWPEENADGVAPEAVGVDTGIGLLQQKILALSPQNEAQRWFQSTALQITRDIAATQWSTFQQVGSQNSLAVSGNRTILAHHNLHELWSVRSPKCHCYLSALRCRACGGRRDLPDPRNGPALWRTD